AGVGVVGVVGVAVYGGRFAGQTPALIMLTLACVGAVLFFSVSRTRSWAVNWVMKIVGRRLGAMGERDWSLRSATFVNAGLLTVASFAVSVFRVWLLAASIGLVLGPLEVSGYVGLTTAAALVPVTVGGVGTRDAVSALALAQLGRPAAEAVALSWLILLLNLSQ